MAEITNIKDILSNQKSDEKGKIRILKEKIKSSIIPSVSKLNFSPTEEEKSNPYEDFQIYYNKYFYNRICEIYRSLNHPESAVNKQRTENGGNFNVYILLHMLKYAMTDKSGKVFIFADEPQKIAFETELHHSISVIKEYLRTLVEFGFFTHEPPATYYVNNEFWSYMQNMSSDINFNTCKLDLNLLDHERIETLLLHDGVPAKLHRLFRILTEHMIRFTNKKMCDLVEHLLYEGYVDTAYIKQGSYQHKTAYKIDFAYEMSSNEEEFTKLLRFSGVKKNIKYRDESYTRYNDLLNSEYFILITPESREQLMQETGYKSSYFHADLSCLCKLGLLEKASAYRFFLKPECMNGHKVGIIF